MRGTYAMDERTGRYAALSGLQISNSCFHPIDPRFVNWLRGFNNGLDAINNYADKMRRVPLYDNGRADLESASISRGRTTK